MCEDLCDTQALAHKHVGLVCCVALLIKRPHTQRTTVSQGIGPGRMGSPVNAAKSKFDRDLVMKIAREPRNERKYNKIK